MERKRRKKIRPSVAKNIVILCFMTYVGYTVVAQQININSKKAELEAINEQIVVEEAEREVLAEEVKTVNTPEWIEYHARTELDMAAPGEIVFIDPTAND